jgi:hypothetical protein
MATPHTLESDEMLLVVAKVPEVPSRAVAERMSTCMSGAEDKDPQDKLASESKWVMLPTAVVLNPQSPEEDRSHGMFMCGRRTSEG